MGDLTHLKTIDCMQGAVRAVRFNVDGSYALTCGSDKKLKLWNPKTGLLLKTYFGHGDEVLDAQGSCDSCHVVSASKDKSIIYWDVSTGQPLRRLRVHAGTVNCVRFNEDSSIAVSGSTDNTVMCWDIRTRKNEPIQVMKDAKDAVRSLIVTEAKIITSSLDGAIRTYDIRSGELTTDTIGEPITHITITKDQQCVLAACSDSTIRLIDTDSGDLLQEFRGHETDSFHIECGVIENDTKIISGSCKGYVHVWDLLQGKEINKIPIGTHVIHSLATHPTGKEILFARKNEIQLWGPPE
ncbi:WD repeat domain-containing protein 83 [Culicoides brevitarsis]|uniref:WD repeat domain-containing protein 83 n=1 Tax=Culicoides brevitarsis TaxID=469753 RepID=UPI00307B35CD